MSGLPVFAALYSPQDMQKHILDIATLSALPDTWYSYEPSQIADSAAAALVAMLDSEFVHIMLDGRRDEQCIEVTRTRERIDPEATRAALLDGPLSRSSEQITEIPNPYGEGTLRIACFPIGPSEGVLVAASTRSDFPSEAQRLLLGMGAKEVALAVDRWHVETDECRFAALVERSSDWIGFASLEGRRQYLNPAGIKLVGLDSMEQARGLHVLDFVVPQERARVRDESWPVVMREGRWVGEIHFRHFKTGAAIPFLVDWFRIDHPRTGQPLNIASISRDLTAQKQAEAELRHLNQTLELRVAERTAELAEAHQKLVSEMKEHERADARLQELQSELSHAARVSAAGQMAAALAHELNQPLAAIANSVNAGRRLLAKGDVETIEAVRQVMDEAAGEVLRAAQIIGRLRDLVARRETERLVESVVTMVEEASALALAGPESLGVEVRFCFDPNASAAFADRVQIQQVLVNLIRNALDAMAESKRRELVLTTARLDEDTIEIAVRDSGPGLIKETIDHLFEPFVSTKRNGMGLGLSICRSIVQAHGGQLRFDPNPGQGAIFIFTLPAAPSAREDHAG